MLLTSFLIGLSLVVIVLLVVALYLFLFFVDSNAPHILASRHYSLLTAGGVILFILSLGAAVSLLLANVDSFVSKFGRY